MKEYYPSIFLLKELIKIPSISRQEDDTATYLEAFFKNNHWGPLRIGNNLICKNKLFDPSKPTILLNSHHDTVKPNEGYTRNPYDPEEIDGKLYGLGSNDAGGSLVSLIALFDHFYSKSIPINLILSATAEEEVSGKNGVSSILKELGSIKVGLVGEPTEMKMSVAEKGLMVLDCVAMGESGHAARDIGTNAIYAAMSDIDWFKSYIFPQESAFLGPIKMTVSQIEAGHQHNVIPDKCSFVVDVRTTDAYSNRETLEVIRRHVKSEIVPRSTRLNPSFLPPENLISKVADELGIEKFGSPTLSDQSLMPFPTFKMGPGKSERSHTANEFIYLGEIEQGIAGYIELFESYIKKYKHETLG